MAYAVAKMETDVGKKLGIKDIAGMQFTASGDPSQMDCVDEATNTTSYLLVLKSNGLIKQHTVEGTMSKENLAKGLVKLNPIEYWPHWTAVLKETKSGQKYAVEFVAVQQRRKPRRGQGRGLVHQGQREVGAPVAKLTALRDH